MTFQDFRAYCILAGDSPEAVDAFIAWVQKNISTWRKFEAVAYQDMQNGNRGDPMWTVGEVRRRYKIRVVNAVSPGLCRMFNHKHRKRFFKVAKMRVFRSEFREAA